MSATASPSHTSRKRTAASAAATPDPVGTLRTELFGLADQHVADLPAEQRGPAKRTLLTVLRGRFEGGPLANVSLPKPFASMGKRGSEGKNIVAALEGYDLPSLHLKTTRQGEGNYRLEAAIPGTTRSINLHEFLGEPSVKCLVGALVPLVRGASTRSDNWSGVNGRHLGKMHAQYGS